MQEPGEGQEVRGENPLPPLKLELALAAPKPVAFVPDRSRPLPTISPPGEPTEADRAEALRSGEDASRVMWVRRMREAVAALSPAQREYLASELRRTAEIARLTRELARLVLRGRVQRPPNCRPRSGRAGRTSRRSRRARAGTRRSPPGGGDDPEPPRLLEALLRQPGGLARLLDGIARLDEHQRSLVVSAIPAGAFDDLIEEWRR